MRNHLWVAAVFVFGLLSCNLPNPQTTKTPLPTPMLDTPTSSISTPAPPHLATVLDIEFPTATPTTTPSTFLASPKDQPVNCRFGPGTAYAVIGALILGRQAEIIGRNSDSTWWYVRNPSDPSTSCWLSADFVTTMGDVQSLPVVNSPVIMVTGVQVRVDPPVSYIACDAFPQVVTIIADVTSSGPSTVTWHWESSTGFASADKQIVFAA
ncbi:MAG TPA: SH3 domain-containing protein, partial [Anaerolineales bacterium]|nr:SH3 domain-containing protein [Anaerolineales bacterium]